MLHADPVCSEPKLFVGGLRFDVSRDEVVNHFQQYGPIKSCVLLTHKDSGKPKGCAMVLYHKWAHAEGALEQDNGAASDLSAPRPLIVKCADPQRRPEDGMLIGVTPKKLFIGQIPRGISQEQIRSICAPYGEIVDANVMPPKRDNAMGCAFVTYSTWAATEAAMEALNGTFTFPGAGQPIMVKLADAKPQDMQRVGAKRGMMDMMGGGGPAKRQMMGGGMNRNMGGMGNMGMGGFGGMGMGMNPMMMGMGGMGMPGMMGQGMQGMGMGMMNPSMMGMMGPMGMMGQGGNMGQAGGANMSQGQAGGNLGQGAGNMGQGQAGGMGQAGMDGQGAQAGADGAQGGGMSGTNMGAGLGGGSMGQVGMSGGMGGMGGLSGGMGNYSQGMNMNMPMGYGMGMGNMGMGGMGMGSMNMPMGGMGMGMGGMGGGMGGGGSKGGQVMGIGNQNGNLQAAKAWKLFIGQISFDLAEPDLFPFFSQFGTVLELLLLRNPGDNRHRGCGFLVYNTAEEAQTALQANDAVLPNDTRQRKILVRYANQKA